jgi:hypothetical protein
VIKFVSDLRQVGLWFSPGTPVSSTNKTDCHNIAEILLKVALSTITLTQALPVVIWYIKFRKISLSHFDANIN